ncbi:hypothetical protein GGF39_001886 [Coemansia sp. RSA 1721]|nr:hypothetical protein GGF39_001886 [Coemansia sp. RSA 1721]
MGKYHRKNNVPWKKNRTKHTSQEEPPAAPDIQIAGLTRNSSGNQHISNNDRSREPDVVTGISIAGKHKGGESQKRQEQQHQQQQKPFAGKNNIKEGSGVEIAGISHVGSTSRYNKQSEEENSENGITIGGKAAMKHRQQEQHGFHPYQKQHGYKYKRYRKETATERLSDDMADGTTRAKSKREIKRQEVVAKKKEYLEKRKNRSLFGYHMSQVVHQDNMDRVAAETAAKLTSGGFNVALASQQQQQQQHIQLQQQQDQQGISNSDLATFLRGLGDYMTATANTIVKATSVSAATNTGGGRTESDIHALSTLSQNSSSSASASVIQNSAEVATASVNDHASTRRKPTASNHMNNTAMVSEQRSEMDIDASRSSHSNTKHYSSSKSKEVLDFDLDVSDIE